jgi:hypothetical protein
MSGCRALVNGKFNFKVDPAYSLTAFAAWADPEMIASGTAIAIPPLEPIDRLIESGASTEREIRAALAELSEATTDETLRSLCAYFGAYLRERPGEASPIMTRAFRNVAIIEASKLHANVAIASID